MAFNVATTVSSSLLKQVLAALSCCFFCLVTGGTMGFSAVLLPQLKEDANFPYNESYDSWVASSACLAMILGSVVGGILSDKYGRRITQLIFAPLLIVGWVVLALASNVTQLLIGRALTGMCHGAFRSTGAVYLGEITNPTNRPFFIFSLTVSTITGSLVSHVLGGYTHWRLFSFIICLPIVLGIGFQLFVKESPLWLIYKGKIDRGTETFIWFRGKDEFSQNELAAVLEKQKDRLSELTFKEGLEAASSKSFMKPLATAFLLFMTAQFSGVNTISFYAQDLFKSTFSGEQDPFLLMLITDCARVIGIAVLFSFSKYISRRSSYLITCATVVALLLAVIAYIAVKPIGLAWMAITVLMFYIAIGTIMSGLSWTFIGEIFPSNLRGLGSGISSSFSFFVLFLSVNATPGIMVNYGIIVVYSTFAVVTFIGLLLLYILLPKTDGKTLQEIENSYTNS